MKKQFLMKLGMITLAVGLSSVCLSADPNYKWDKRDKDDYRHWKKHEKERRWEEPRDRRWREEWRERDHRTYYNSYVPPPRTHVQIFFNTNDRRCVFDYYRVHDRHYWASRYPSNLPPGLYKHLVRNGHLPPGLERQLVPFPVEIERHLCPLPRNYFRFMLGGKGLIVDAQFNVIDVMDLY